MPTGLGEAALRLDWMSGVPEAGKPGLRLKPKGFVLYYIMPSKPSDPALGSWIDWLQAKYLAMIE